MPMFSVVPRSAAPSYAADRRADAEDVPPAAVDAPSFAVGDVEPDVEPVAPTKLPNPDFPHNHPTSSTDHAPSAATDASSDVHDSGQHLPVRVAPSPGLALARANDGLPMVLDPFAVASRAVLVLIGSMEPAKHIARTAIEMSIEHDSSAALDVVIPRAIDLVLRRAAHLVSIGAGPKVVDHYTERLELWRRLARRSGLEPAAIVLTLAPFPIPTVASMLRVSLAEVEACIDDWYAGVDPEDDRPVVATPSASADPVIDLRPAEAHEIAHPVVSAATRQHRQRGWPRWRVRDM